MNRKTADYLIIGAGIYGLYFAYKVIKTQPQKRVIVLEIDAAPFQRASYINQARVHSGYHYPRSVSTALKSIKYYHKFIDDFSFAINNKFEKIYAVSSDFSYTTKQNFQKFCEFCKVKCEEINPDKYFKKGMIDGCFIAEETAFDAGKIASFLAENIAKGNGEIIYNTRFQSVKKDDNKFTVILDSGVSIETDFILNASYASTNQIAKLFGFNDMFKIKYEITEMCLCNVSDNIKRAGLTVMDGPFFSIMPFGLTGYHSLSSVHFTPHKTCYNELPVFNCQKNNPNCTPEMFDNCNHCPAKPETAWASMAKLAEKYLNSDIKYEFVKSLFAVKPIMKSSETSDSRPTIIKRFSAEPKFYSVLSGKFNTIYDLDEVLNDD